MDMSITKSIMDTLYRDIQGYDLSFSARKKLQFHDKGLTYGEIVPESFYKILSQVNPQKDEVFYDLGSGTGKAVLAASLFFPFSKTVGVELLDDLYDASQQVLQRYQKEIIPRLNTSNSPEIKFFQADFLDFDFSDADVIFAHATCFHDGQLRELLHKFEKLKKGARLIIVSKEVDSHSYALTNTSEHPFSWGQATLHFYEKIV
ncbi:hypothetical protein A3B50_04450 [Candidatus Roizmanbacteria bacterium RIFCSPLOWO2_01_FULL_40_42]|uniref:Histone-lysine N-methyltransferase, H3 lysine-79 specific n=1 Tax=Candidatus Roizmanbacteria bacterium RIFCSPLOWO2_01_FULL_40_42 TaxID=1802066 RepID=A0A1F7J526_9BACT|nr:MAG: hypothetical protein A3B50_04450 [Candidatus Roizmanbacteria bacterium RIFCSPLOWO2_01_FULL_40_42]OGK59657.1 MAG: hypothetical protein A3H84_00185 [Candidatus Roizmanbacteria bacterium RIFCSPLOWO2_02_FULL_40_13]